MPQRSKGPRLYWREGTDRESVWEIRDTENGRRIRQSTGTAIRSEAEVALENYLTRKRRGSGPASPEEMTVAEVLTIYAEGHAVDVAAPERIGYAIDALDDFWRDLSVSDVTKATCKRYAASRGKAASTVRRELGTLQAAINHCAREGHLTQTRNVHLPEKGEATERWLTRREAAWLLRGARALNKDGRHLQDFILHGLYTGSRKATILAMQIDTVSLIGGRVDTVNGVLYRKPPAKTATKKRQGASRIPPRYLAHLRRQAANGRKFVVERTITRKVKGEIVEERAMVAEIRKGWARAVELAEELARDAGISIDLTMMAPQGRKPITPHVLKHTAITWALQKGASIWDAAGYFDTSPETIQNTYGHHHPDFQESAVEAINRRG